MNRSVTAMNTSKRVSSWSAERSLPPVLSEGPAVLIAWLVDGLRAPLHALATENSCESREGATRHLSDRSPLGIRSEPDNQLALLASPIALRRSCCC
jgi:hypothetical protein